MNRSQAETPAPAPEQVSRRLSEAFGKESILLAVGNRLRVADEEVRVIAFPHDPRELGEMLQLASSERWRVIPMGAGTWLEMGNRATAAQLFISTARLSRILDYEPADLTATVEAGCPLAAFNAEAARHRQFIPLDPFGEQRSTIGATVATASAGPLRAAYGTPRDWVIGMRIAHADGHFTKAGGKVVKNVAGYDLCKLYTGSYGTLGVISELSFKLRTLPPAEQTIIFGADEAGPLCALAARLPEADLFPASVEIFTRRGLEAGLFPPSRFALALRLLDEPEAVEAQLETARQLGAELAPLTLEAEEATRFWDDYRAAEIAPQWAYSLRLGALPSHLASALAELEATAPGAALRIHAASGVIRAHAEGDWLSDLKTAQRPRRLAELRQRAQSRGGSLVIVRAPDEIRAQLDAWGEVGPTARLMRELKGRFDPESLLNPGRFVAGI
jgi:glycolate oxidase FAD binding subunit